MLQATQGFVLNTIKYSETSVIAKIYTQHFGLRAYIINGVRTTKGRSKAAMLQPLNHLDLVVYERENKSINRIKEMKFATIYQNITFDVRRSAIALFLTEVFHKVLKEESANENLFDFIFQVSQQLENSSVNDLANLHSFYLLQLTQLLGFYPDNNYTSQNQYFDLKEGVFTWERPIYNRIIDQDTSLLLHQMLQYEFDDWRNFMNNRNQRRLAITTLLSFYDWQIENFGKINSLNVLEKIF